MLYTLSKPQQVPPEPPAAPTGLPSRICASDFADRSEMVATMLLSPSGLGQIKAGMEKHFYSKGAFNLVQLVLYLLKQTGPAHVFLSSYSIAEDSLAALKRREESGELLSIRFLIDNRVRSISPKPFGYLAEAFHGKYRCCALHAKVALLWNSEWHIAVVTSREVFDFDLKTLNDEFEQGKT